MFYPWNLSDQSGALALFTSYSRALSQAGYRLDCYAPRGTADEGIFENVYLSPDRNSPLSPILEVAGSRWEDPLLPEKAGRDETTMAAAAVLAAISDYDVIGIQYTRCHSLKPMLPPGIPAVMFTHDLDALVGQQEEMIFGTPAEYRIDDEAARLKPFDLVTVVGPDDRRLLHSVDPELPIVEAPFTAAIANDVPVREQSEGTLLWMSSAASFHRFSFFWFWRNVWPRVRRARPGCRLVIAGRIAEMAAQLGAADDAQVAVLGVVNDADSVYRDADVLIAPYYYGLGIKTKVIEAMAKGIPVATTTLGIYNTQIEPGRDAIVSDDAAAYANEIVRLISSAALRREISRNGLAYVRKRHDPANALAPFVEAFDKARQSRKTASKARTGARRDLYEPLRHLVPWTIQRCQNDNVRTVAIFGAGGHTRLLVPLWKAFSGPAIKRVVVSNGGESSCMGFPVVSADRFDPRQVDGIVLSSHGYEQEMAAICNDRWPETRVYPIWRPIQQASRPAVEDFSALCKERIPPTLFTFPGSEKTYDHTTSLPV